MENVKVEYSSFYLEAMKQIKEAHDLLVKRDFQGAYEACINAQTELRLMGGAIKTWILTEDA
jgi:hypothetical protein